MAEQFVETIFIIQERQRIIDAASATQGRFLPQFQLKMQGNGNRLIQLLTFLLMRNITINTVISLQGFVNLILHDYVRGYPSAHIIRLTNVS